MMMHAYRLFEREDDPGYKIGLGNINDRGRLMTLAHTLLSGLSFYNIFISPSAFSKKSKQRPAIFQGGPSLGPTRCTCIQL